MIGRLAAVPNTGDGGSSNTRPPFVITPLEGLRAVFGDRVAVEHDDGADPARAAELARGADAALVVVGYTHDDEGEYVEPGVLGEMEWLYPPPAPDEEALARDILSRSGEEHGMPPGGDRASLRLHPADEALISAVAAANPRTIVAVMTGSAVITEGWRDEVAALLVLWYPGMEGGLALADLVTGRRVPAAGCPARSPRATRTCRSSTATPRRSPTTSGTATASSIATVPSRPSRSGSGSATRRSRSATCGWRRRSSPRATCSTPRWR